MDPCFFHPATVRTRLSRRLPGRTNSGCTWVVAAGLRAEVEMEMGERVDSLPGTRDEFFTARSCTPISGHDGRLLLISSGDQHFTDLSSALDPSAYPARVVIARLGESFSSLASSALRLQDEGIVHGAIAGRSVRFNERLGRTALGRFSCSVPMRGLTARDRERYYPQFDAKADYRSPEFHLLTIIVHSAARHVTNSDIERVRDAVGNKTEHLDKIIGLGRTSAIASLEATWRTWDGYSLCRLFTELVQDATCTTDISQNAWLSGVLSVLENGAAVDPSVRPGLIQLRRLFEKAWYHSGSVDDCQAALDAVEAKAAGLVRAQRDSVQLRE